MSLTIVGFTYATSNTGSEPTGTVSGDLVYAWAINTGGSTIPSTPAAWTPRGSDSITLAAAYRSASIQRGGSAPSYTFANATEVAVLALRPYNSGGTFKETDNQFSSTTGPQSPAESAFTNPSLVVSVLLIDGAGGNINSIPSGYTNLTGGVNIRAAYKIVQSTSETPGAWILNAAQSGFAATAVIPVILTTTVTKTVASSAAVSATVTKTVSSAVAVSQAVTKPVTTSGAISMSRTATVATTAAIGHVRDIGTSAAISTTKTKTVPSSVAASRAVQKGVDSQGAVSTTAMTEVSTSASVHIPRTVRLTGGYVVTSRGY